MTLTFDLKAGTQFTHDTGNLHRHVGLLHFWVSGATPQMDGRTERQTDGIQVTWSSVSELTDNIK